jgi:hypothetical protein
MVKNSEFLLPERIIKIHPYCWFDVTVYRLLIHKRKKRYWNNLQAVTKNKTNPLFASHRVSSAKMPIKSLSLRTDILYNKVLITDKSRRVLSALYLKQLSEKEMQ